MTMKWTLPAGIICLFLGLPLSLLHGQHARNDISRFTYHLHLADSFHAAQQLDSATHHFQQGIRLGEELTQDAADSTLLIAYLEGLMGYGTTLKDLSQYREAQAQLARAEERALKNLGQSHLMTGRIWMEMGAVADMQEDTQTSLTYYTRSYDILSTALPAEDPLLSKLRANIGSAYSKKAQYHKALQYLLPAEKSMARRLGKRAFEMGVLYNIIGVTYDYMGDYDLALDYYQLARDIFVEQHGEDNLRVAGQDNNIGLIYFHKNQFEKALEYYSRALKVLKSHFGENHQFVGILYANTGVTYEGLGDYGQAEAYQRKALAVKARLLGRNSPAYASSISYLANVFRRQGLHQKALDHYRQAQAMLIQHFGTRHPFVSRTYNEMAKVYMDLGHYDQAAQMSRQAIETVVSGFSSTEGIPLSATDVKIMHEFEFLEGLKGLISATLASAPQDLDKLAAVWQLQQTSIQLIDRMHSGYKQEGSKLFLQEYVLPIYSQAIATLYQLHEQAANRSEAQTYAYQAFALSEKTKAIILGQGIRSAKVSGLANIPPDMAERESLLRNQIGFFRNAVFEGENAPETDTTQLFSNRDELFRASQSYDSLLAEFKARYPAYYRLRYETEPPSVPEVQAYLKAHSSLLLTYFWGEQDLFRFTVSADSFHFSATPLDSSLLASIDHFRRYVSSLDSTQVAPFARLGHQLSQQLGLIEALARPEQHWLIIPDASLSFIPFEALLGEPPRENQGFSSLPYLIQSKTLRYEYATALAMESFTSSPDERPRPPSAYAGFAPTYASETSWMASRSPFFSNLTEGGALAPLTYNQGEVADAARLMGGQAYTGQLATESAFKAHAGSQRVLHLAMHAFTHDEQPEYSGLAFYLPPPAVEPQADSTHPPSAEDGYLHAYEIYNMRLMADLAVLSACQTGLGKQIRGEGIMSLARAFKYAGCRNILTSLWQANDQSTQQIIRAFFGHLTSARPKDEALRLAKLQYLDAADPFQAHPALWATLVLVGDQQALDVASQTPWKGWWVLIGLALAGLVGIILNRFGKFRRSNSP